MNRAPEAMRDRYWRRERISFDEVHATLARLAMLHERLNDVDLDDEQVLVAQLAEARAELDTRMGE